MTFGSVDEITRSFAPVFSSVLSTTRHVLPPSVDL
jgi:hypothetical protein